MGRKLADIEKEIKSNNELFSLYLENELQKEVSLFLTEISSHTNTYLFSGIIRNYFLRNFSIRDVDLVVESDEGIQDVLANYEYRRNSYGGYKLKVGNMDVDLWSIDKTWAFNNVQTILSFGLEKYLPHTAFFNFSAIMYSINEKKFYYSKHFLYFLKNKTIDIVLTPNANYKLCLVNSFYYSHKYKLKISTKLKELIQRIFFREEPNYEDVQTKHFGKIIYSNEEIERLVLSISI